LGRGLPVLGHVSDNAVLATGEGSGEDAMALAAAEATRREAKSARGTNAMTHGAWPRRDMEIEARQRRARICLMVATRGNGGKGGEEWAFESHSISLSLTQWQ